MKLTKRLKALLVVLVAVSVATSVTFAESSGEKADASKKTNAELAEEMAGKTAEALKSGPLSYPKGKGLRIVSTGHSWVDPALRTLPAIAKAAGLDGHRQRKHIRGGAKGKADAIWRAEIGRLNNGSEARPILIPAIATGDWDVMTWGVYLQDRAEHFEQWIEFCLKYNPEMEFYLQDAWTGTSFYKTEDKLSLDRFVMAQTLINTRVNKIMQTLEKKYPGKVRVIPVGNSMLEMLKLYYRKELPGIEGLSAYLCHKEHTFWRDGGHLGKHMAWWEGYCYYAAIYKKSPELIEARFDVTEYSEELDRAMRRCAWKAVTEHPYSRITDKNGNGIADQIEPTPGKKNSN